MTIYPNTSNFKFHYVSINSEIPTVVKIAMCNTLNSIMFLLILTGAVLDGYAVCDFKFHYVSINSLYLPRQLLSCSPLNSIMFLLIRIKRV